MTKEEQLRKVFLKIVLDIMDNALGEQENMETDFLLKKYVNYKVNELLTEVKIRTKI